MKKMTLMAASAALVFGLSGCTDAEMAAVEEGIAEAGDMTQMENDCKNYLAQKIPELPMAAFSVSPGYGSNGRYTIPVKVNWDEPRVEETGKCVIVNGIVRNYIVTSN
jgi:hypothetical protein